MTTRAWLKTNIASVIKDHTLSTSLDTWIDIGAARLGEILRCREMETSIVRGVGAPDPFIPLAEDTQEILAVQKGSEDGNYYNLRGMVKVQADMYKGAGTSVAYYVEDSKVYPIPFNDTNFIVLTLDRPSVPVAEDETTALLTQYPYLFLDAALVEAYDFKEDNERVVRYDAKWRDAARTIRNTYERTRFGEGLAMRAC